MRRKTPHTEESFTRVLVFYIEQMCTSHVHGGTSVEAFADPVAYNQRRHTEREFEAAAWKLLFEAKEPLAELWRKAERHRQRTEKIGVGAQTTRHLVANKKAFAADG